MSSSQCLSHSKDTIPFPLERDLVKELTPIVPQLFDKNAELAVLHEFELGPRIADMAIGFKNIVTQDSNTYAALLSLTSCFDQAVMAKLLERNLSQNSIAKKLFCGKGEIEKSINKLIRIGVVTADGNMLSAIFLRSVLPNEILFIEAKLTDWKEALNQACRYKHHSHSVYIAMPEKFSYNKLFISACQKNGIGFISVSPGKAKIELLHRGKPSWSFSHNLVRIKFAVAIERNSKCPQ